MHEKKRTKWVDTAEVATAKLRFGAIYHGATCRVIETTANTNDAFTVWIMAVVATSNGHRSNAHGNDAVHSQLIQKRSNDGHES